LLYQKITPIDLRIEAVSSNSTPCTQLWWLW
jgi:hypothetical protein